jgi:hypothetical protein
MNNLDLYNKVRSVPPEAKKKITGGRLNGMTDINPMWRIRVLTEQFGPCGIGWKYVITKQWIEEGANGEKAAFTNIDLYIKIDGQWSEAIPGTGGSMLIASEKQGTVLKTSDECFKMALTDAISVSCKALGVGADVYWEKDKTKYALEAPQSPQTRVRGGGNMNTLPTTPKPVTRQNRPISDETCTNPTCKTPKTKLTPEVVKFSLDKYGKVLCRYCQSKHRTVSDEVSG